MGYSSLREAVADLEANRHLVRVTEEVDAHLEAAEIQRRIFRAGGPALLFERVKNCTFPMVSNLFGSRERVHFMFRDSLRSMHALVSAKVSPKDFLRDLGGFARLPLAATHLLPRPVLHAPVLDVQTTISALPQLVSWPDDGGAFITLPQVYSEDPEAPGLRSSNLGMYRVQLAGNQYIPDREIGLHYQLHRGIGVHHSKAVARKQRFPVNIFVGGPPAMTVAAVMPLPEGMPELAFAGALNNRAIRVQKTKGGIHFHAEADFLIRGYVTPGETKLEGPFGDHLGYYSNAHQFPVLHIESVSHRKGAIWPFTVVGRPPQEDTMFGDFIHELTANLIPDVLPGVRAVHAVDAAGVHPLLFALGSERYVPFADARRPMEVLTQASAILGQGQMSLAKYLFIAAHGDNPALDIRDIRAFLTHILERFDPRRDLHFHVNTTMDTLDYSGTGLNQGSKLVWAAVGDKKRVLSNQVPSDLALPTGFEQPRSAMPGVLVVTAPRYNATEPAQRAVAGFCEALAPTDALSGFPLIVLCDDSEFTARNLDNFVWATFTRSNPATDIHGVRAFTQDKAWGCEGSVVIDARRKPHHAAPLLEDPVITKRVDTLFHSGSLKGLE